MDIDLSFVRIAQENSSVKAKEREMMKLAEEMAKDIAKREMLAKEYIRKCKIRDFLCTALNVMGIISGIAFIIGLLVLNYAITGVPV